MQLSIDKGIGTIVFDAKDKKLNILSAAVLKEFDQLMFQLKSKSLKALIIKSNKKNCFIAGADIAEIKDLTDPKDAIRKVKMGF